MSLLSYNELCELVEQGVIRDVTGDQINGASIDVRLGNTIIVETCGDLNKKQCVDIQARTNFPQKVVEIGNEYHLAPGEFILAHTREKFYLPDDIVAEFKLKSSGARSGLDNALATWCDQNWHDSVLTLELRNNLRHTHIILRPGMFIGQMVFYRTEPVPHERSYAVRGRYNKDSSVQQVKL